MSLIGIGNALKRVDDFNKINKKRGLKTLLNPEEVDPAYYKYMLNKLGIKGKDKQLETLKSLGLGMNGSLAGKSYADLFKDDTDFASISKAISSNKGLSRSVRSLNEKLIEDVNGGLGEANALKQIQAEMIKTGEISQTVAVAGNGAFATLKTGASGFLAVLKSVAPLLIAVGAAITAYKVFDALHLSYSEAQDNLTKSANERAEALSNLKNKEQELANTRNKIRELRNSQKTGSLSMDDEAELNRLLRQERIVEKEIKIAQKRADLASKQAAHDAKTTIEYKNKHMGITKMDRLEYAERQVKTIKSKEAEIARLEKELESKSFGAAPKYFKKKAIERDKEAIAEIRREVPELLKELEAEKANFFDAGGNIVSGYEDIVNRINTVTGSINTDGFSKLEKQITQLDSFFDGTPGKNFIKEYLLDAAKSGEDVNKALKGIGLNVKDLGANVDSSSLNRYFKELADEAEKAEQAMVKARKLSNNLSISDIDTAFESKNAGSDYVAFADYMKKAKELYDKGLVGTDDFKSVAQALSYGNDATPETFKENYQKIQRYFVEDASDKTKSKGKDVEDNLKAIGIENFLTDLSKLPDSIANVSKEQGKWNIDIKNTAKAAKELGIGVTVFEAILGRIMDYDNAGDFKFVSAIKQLEQAESTINSFDTVLNKLDEGIYKDNLNSSVEGWKKQLEGWEDDLSALDKDIVMHIKLAYNLAEIQAEIDGIKRQLDLDPNNSEKQTEYIAANEAYIKKAKKGLGFNKEGVSSSALLNKNDNRLSSLKSSVRSSTDESERLIFKAEIGNRQEMEKALIDEFSRLNPKINFESSVEDINKALAEFLSKPQHLKIDTVMDGQAVKEFIEELQEGASISFKTDIEGKERILTATKINGKIRYFTNIDGVIYEVNEKKDTNGTITYGANTKPIDGDLADELEKTGTVVYGAKWDIGNPPPKIGYVTYKPIYSGSGFGGTSARADGTMHAYARGTTVSLNKNQAALVNELGQESIVRDGRWMMIPGGSHVENLKRGDIIFNAQQTADLISHGYIRGANKHGRVAYATGTAYNMINAYAGYANGGFSFGGGSSGVSSSRASSVSKPSQSQISKSASKVKKATDKATDAIADYFDWIAVRLERLAHDTKLTESMIDRSIGLAGKQLKTAQTYNNIEREIKAAQAGYTEYLSHAYGISQSNGLSEDIKNKVANGTINIEQFDGDKKKAISEFQNFYNQAISCKEKILDLEKKQYDLTQKRLDIIEEYYGLVINIHRSTQDIIDANLDFNQTYGLSAISNSVISMYKDSIKEADMVRTNLSNQLHEYKIELNDALKTGRMEQGSDSYLKAQSKINEFEKAIIEASTSIEKFNDKLREVQYFEFNNIVDRLTRTLERYSHRYTLNSARDITDTESTKRDEAQTIVSKLRANTNLRNAKEKEQSYYAVNSNEYQRIEKELSQIDSDNIHLLENLENIKKQIFEIRFKPLVDDIDSLKNFNSELNDTKSLLNPKAFYDKKGGITGQGLANLAILQNQLVVSKQTIADYRTALEKLQANYKNGIITQKEFNNKTIEYQKCIRDAAISVNDLSEELSNLYLKQMQVENSALQENISKRKEALKTKEDYYNYDKRLRSESKDVNLLKSQIEAMKGVNNLETQAEVKRLEQKLLDAEESLSETKRSHSVDMQSRGYDALSDELNDMLSDVEYNIAHSADKQQEIISSMLDNVVGEYRTAFNTITNIVGSYGISSSKQFASSIGELGTGYGANKQKNEALSGSSYNKPHSSVSSISTSALPVDNNIVKTAEYNAYKDESEKMYNRKVADIVLKSASSVSIYTGDSSTVSYAVRPSDAANQKLSWRTTDSSVATMSGNTIVGKGSGSCVAIGTTTDGTGKTVMVSVSVSNRPMPTPTNVSQSSSSNSNVDNNTGKSHKSEPSIGDSVTYASGRYYYDSGGTRPSGNQMLGKTVYVTRINRRSWATKPYHISRDPGEAHPLGWVTLDQLAGYSMGSKNILGDQWALTDENGREIIIDPKEGIMTNKGTVRHLTNGSAVIPNNLTENLYEWGAIHPSQYLSVMGSTMGVPTNKPEISVHTQFDKLINVEGNVDKDTLPELKDIIELSYRETSKRLADEMSKLGFKKRR